MNTRYDLINAFIKARKYKSFLEIGTAGGETFRAVNCEIKVSVDPCKEAGATFQMTSDEFFATNRNASTSYLSTDSTNGTRRKGMFATP